MVHTREKEKQILSEYTKIGILGGLPSYLAYALTGTPAFLIIGGGITAISIGSGIYDYFKFKKEIKQLKKTKGKNITKEDLKKSLEKTKIGEIKK